MGTSVSLEGGLAAKGGSDGVWLELGPLLLLLLRGERVARVRSEISCTYIQWWATCSP